MAGGRLARHEGFIAGDGARIYYKMLGRGMPLLVLHGGPGSDHSYFLPAFAPLARNFRLIFIDQRGSGRSERLADPGQYTLDKMVADVECVRRHLGLRRFVLLGHSFGGILAQAYAARHPNRLAGLVLAGTASRAKDIDRDFRDLLRRTPTKLRQRVAALEARGIYRTDGSYVPAYATATARVLAPVSYAHTSRQQRRREMPLGLDVLREMWGDRSDFVIHGNLKGFDFSGSLARLRTPSLVIIGDRDIVSPASAERSRSILRRATLVIMAEAAHMMFVDDRRRFLSLLEDFMRQCARELKGSAG
jgi:proline iminopeptidase